MQNNPVDSDNLNSTAELTPQQNKSQGIKRVASDECLEQAKTGMNFFYLLHIL